MRDVAVLVLHLLTTVVHGESLISSSIFEFATHRWWIDTRRRLMTQCLRSRPNLMCSYVNMIELCVG